MSARKSYDVEAKRPAGGAKPARRKKRRAAPAEAAPRRRKSLRAKREEAKGRKNTVTLALSALALGAIIYALWLPEVRIQAVSAAESPDPAGIEAIAKEHLSGSYYHLIPRDSFFFYSPRDMRAAILDAYPSISAISLRRTGFDELSIQASSRASAFLWCGPAGAAHADASDCYEADAEGFVFAPATVGTTTGDGSLIHIYAALDAASSTDSYPLRSKVVGAESLPDILRFARAITSLSIPLRSIALRGDEADLYSAGGTRITYVVGKEREAADIAEATFDKLNFMDGSVEYVDLRFGNKAFIKRRE